eukprot:scaffold410135_cov15-Prasinocladus_malaysianus.AAC.1
MQLLRVGVYELTELSLPVHALNDHVELAKRGIHEGAGKFANGERLSQMPRRLLCCQNAATHFNTLQIIFRMCVTTGCIKSRLFKRNLFLFYWNPVIHDII